MLKWKWDISTTLAGVARTYTRNCLVNTRSGDTLFEKKDQLVCAENMRVQQVKFKLTGDVHSVSYSGNYVVRTGKVLIMQVLNTAQYYISDSDPSRGISLYYYPCSETFESSAYERGLMAASSKLFGMSGTLADAAGFLTDTYQTEV